MNKQRRFFPFFFSKPVTSIIQPGPNAYPCPTCGRPYMPHVGAIQCLCGAGTLYTKQCSCVQNNINIPHRWECINCPPSHNINTDLNNTTLFPAPKPDIPPLLGSSVSVAPVWVPSPRLGRDGGLGKYRYTFQANLRPVVC